MDEQMIELMARAICESGAVTSLRWEERSEHQKNCFRKDATAAHSVMAGKVAELTKQRLMILAAVYREAPKFVATICDQDLDRSGKLLGEVRALADAALAPYPERR